MKINWLGHACFIISLSNGKKIITDPFGNELGYPQPGLPADIVTVSHQHFDHNAISNVPRKPLTVQTEGLHSIEGINITGVPSFHDKSGGSKRGDNIIFIIEAEGIRICHLGDLGHMLDSTQISRIGKVDILLLPTGGFYTIGPDEAAEIANQIKPGYVIPMHYKTDYIDFPISTPDQFLKYFPGYKTEKELVVTRNDLPETTQVVIIELKN
ncbi:MAG: MBL fold metallo-hydrolase [Bacillota bacterium]